jgi:hypothetical protein
MSFKVKAVMEVTEFWKTLIPSEYVTVTKCYCVVQKRLFRSEYGISWSLYSTNFVSDLASYIK